MKNKFKINPPQDDKKFTLETAKENNNIFTFQTDEWFNKEHVIEKAKNSPPNFNLKINKFK